MPLWPLLAFLCSVGCYRLQQNPSSAFISGSPGSGGVLTRCAGWTLFGSPNSTGGSEPRPSRQNSGHSVSPNWVKLARLHNEAFEAPEFQLHVPPSSDFLPSLNPRLTSSPVYSSLTSPDGTSAGESTTTSDEPHTSSDADDYIDGPLDVLAMVKSGLIPEFRHCFASSSPSNTTNGHNANTGSASSSDSSSNHFLTCRFERPADVFILNYSTIDLGHREYIYTACRLLSRLGAFKSDSPVQQLFERVFDNDIPVWLSTCFHYSLPFTNCIKDYVLAVYFYLNHYLDAITAIKSKNAKSALNKAGQPPIADSTLPESLDSLSSASNATSSPNGTNPNADWTQSLNRLIRNGNPFDLVDYLSTERYRLSLTGLELQTWKVDGLHSKLLDSFKNVDLNQLFLEERNQLKSNYKLYSQLVMYRKNHRPSFNSTLVELINYYIQYLKMPLYIVTDVEEPKEVYSRLKMFGVKSNDLLTVLNRSDLQIGLAANGRDIGSISATDEVEKAQSDSQGLTSRNNGLLSEDSQSVDTQANGGHDQRQSVDDMASQPNVIADQLLSRLDPMIPIHYFDNSIHNLKSIMANPRLENVRLYFVDWGRSSYSHKLEALYTDKIKYIKTTYKLVEFICKFNTYLSREWTHGYRLRYPGEEEQTFLLNWKEKWHKPAETTISGNSRMLPNI